MRFRDDVHIEQHANELIGKTWRVSLVDEVNIKERGYTFAWNNRIRRTLGRCNYRKRKIELSKKVALLNLNKPGIITDTILHEIAHAINYTLYNQTGHGKTWKSICRQIGANPSRLSTDKGITMPRGKYTLHCPICGWSTQIYRKRKRRSSCPECGDGFDERYVLEVKENPTDQRQLFS